MVQLNQASGILSLLDENNNELKLYALNKLNEIVGKNLLWLIPPSEAGRSRSKAADFLFEF